MEKEESRFVNMRKMFKNKEEKGVNEKKEEGRNNEKKEEGRNRR